MIRFRIKLNVWVGEEAAKEGYGDGDGYGYGYG